MCRALKPVIHVTAVIHNGSEELIGPATIQLVDAGENRIWDDVSIEVETIDPKGDYVVNLVLPSESSSAIPSVESTVTFRDASGYRWRRHRSDPVERLRSAAGKQGPGPRQQSNDIQEKLKPQGAIQGLGLRLRRLLRKWRG